MRAVRLAPLLLLALAACVAQTRLVPAPGVPEVRREAAFTEGEGVRLVADASAWRGNPSDLAHVLTPVFVRVDNHSGRPLRLGHEAFALAGDSGFRFAALAPFAPAGQGMPTAAVAAPRPDAPPDAPPYAPYAPSVAVRGHRGWGWGGPWGPSPWAPWGYGPWGPGWWDPFWGPGSWGGYGPPQVVEPLPTRDMVRKALPEGTLEEGGSIGGFLYFPDVGGREQRVELTATLTDARTGEAFGTLTIPFEVVR